MLHQRRLGRLERGFVFRASAWSRRGCRLGGGAVPRGGVSVIWNSPLRGSGADASAAAGRRIRRHDAMFDMRSSR